MSDPFEPLRRDVSYLGRVLGETLVEQEGAALLELEETIRGLAKERRAPLPHPGHRGRRDEAATRLSELILALDTGVAERVARAFTHYFQLVNLAEQHHRTRRRRDYARAKKAQPGSLDIVFGPLVEALGSSSGRPPAADRFAEILASTSVELVFTAHPSEAQRRTVLEKHRRLIALLARRDRTELTPDEEADLDARMREEVAALWQTDEIRQEKPRVGDEVKNVLFYLEEILFPLVPRFYGALERACERALGVRVAVPCLLQFGSWVGADMDGNPNVTPEVAVDTAVAQASRVLELYLKALTTLGGLLSQSTRRVGVSAALTTSLVDDAAAMPELVDLLEATTHHEPYRRKLRFVSERLQATRAALVRFREDTAKPLTFAPHAYTAPAGFLADLALVRASLVENRGAHAGHAEVQALIRQVETFGFHLARLDVRIPADWVRADARVALALGPDDPLDLAALARGIVADPSTLVVPDGQGMKAVEALAKIRAVTFEGGAESLVLSMTRGAEDMLSALLLARLAKLDAGGPRTDTVAARGSFPPRSIASPSSRIAIVPLFETLDDLERSATEFARAVESAPYAAYLARRGSVQEIMLGYSDSNKDAGIVGSSFALYRAQQRLVRVSQEHGFALKIFHGRGGSIGRGGGPAQRAIESLPAGSVSGRFKLTEQGEVLGWKYLVPEIAERNLELTVAGVIAQSFVSEEAALARQDAAGRTVPPVTAETKIREHEALFEEVAAISVAHYRALIHDPAFPEYFAFTTPIEEIPRLNIGSRPARRTGEGERAEAPALKLEDLRAIPWVFGWTQSRQMVPGWYGAGRSLSWLLRQHGVERIRAMREEWPFFSSTLDAIAVSLAQADMVIASRYAALLEDRPSRRLFFLIALDHARAVRVLDQIVGRHPHDRPDRDARPLDPESTLARSIELRNPYVDPLSFIQIELLRRKRAYVTGTGRTTPPELQRAILLTINGLAAGLRTTG